MNYSELNEYIENYLKKDKTNTAIMLNGPWGSGKSYYVKNILKNFLDSGNTENCIIISLYGASTVEQVSKSIFLELRLKFLSVSNKKILGIKLASKTILKAFLSYNNIDLSANKKDLKNLLESIDLSGKLIIFEDLERSKIDIVEFIGYVNNLVEQESAKILLVANENEIANEQYKVIKEKTVSDTIKFRCSYTEAIKNIIRSFGNEHLNKFLDEDKIDMICRIVNDRTGNLRTFIFACQKTVTIFDYISANKKPPFSFLESIFYGNIAYSFKIKTGLTDEEHNKLHPYGNIFSNIEEFNVLPFCQKLIDTHEFDKDDFENELKIFILRNKENLTYVQNNEFLNVIFTYYVQTPDEVKRCLEKLENNLTNDKNIDIGLYGRIANAIVLINELLKFDISNCKKYLIENLKGKQNHTSVGYLFINYTEFDTEEKRNEFKDLKNEMIKSLKYGVETRASFIQRLEQTSELNNFSNEEYSEIILNKKFLADINIDKFTNNLNSCNAEQIYIIREILERIYRSENIKDFLAADITNMKILITNVKKFEEETTTDPIIKKQLTLFKNDLKYYLGKLS